MTEKYRDNPLQAIDPIDKQEPSGFTKRVYTLMDMILKPEKCPVCGEWMKPYTTFTKNYTHQKLERACEACLKQN